jgi:hypothetical protein
MKIQINNDNYNSTNANENRRRKDRKKNIQIYRNTISIFINAKRLSKKMWQRNN